MHLCAFTQYRITFQLKSFQRLVKKRKKKKEKGKENTICSGLTLSIHQVPTEEAPAFPFSAGEGTENVTKGSWVKIRAGNINQVRSGLLKFQSLVSLHGGNGKAEVCKGMVCPTARAGEGRQSLWSSRHSLAM